MAANVSKKQKKKNKNIENIMLTKTTTTKRKMFKRHTHIQTYVYLQEEATLHVKYNILLILLFSLQYFPFNINCVISSL